MPAINESLDTYTAQLRSAIDRADQYYHQHKKHLPKLTDAEYDALKSALRQHCPDDERLTRVGVPYSDAELRTKVKHQHPAGSLDNTAGGIAGFAPWYLSLTIKLKDESPSVMLSHKMDGSTAVATYKDGKLVSVVTRGNGEYGEDVTANAVKWKWLPTCLPIQASVTVRGEVMLYKNDFNAIMKEQEVADDEISNPRNIGNGIVGRLDGMHSELLRFVAFNIMDANDNRFELDVCDRFETLKAFGFHVVEHQLIVGESLEDIETAVVKWCDGLEAARPMLPYEIDGVVVSLDSNELQQKLIESPRDMLRPKHSRAIKFTSFKATTKIIGCNITIGHTGAVIPTAILEKVRIGSASGGVFVQNVLLNNWDEIGRLGVAIGDTVEIELAGDIIPKVVRVVEQGPDRQEIIEPAEFNGCKTTRMHRGKAGAVTYLVDADETSEIKKNKIKHYIGSSKKGVGILGIGDGVLDALTAGENPLVKTPADLYRLTLEQLVDLPIGTNSAGGIIKFGKSRANSLLAEIAKAKSLPLHKFLGALGIDLLGSRKAEQLIESCGFTNLDDWLNAEKTAAIPGDATRMAIREGLLKARPVIDDLLAVGVVVGTATAAPAPVEGTGDTEVAPTVDDPRGIRGRSFCFTGTRDLLEEVEAAGGIIKSGISKGLNFLVQRDPLSLSNKTKKADELGIQIISIDFLREVLEGKESLIDATSPSEC